MKNNNSLFIFKDFKRINSKVNTLE